MKHAAAVASLAEVRALRQSDREYADGPVVSKHGMDFLSGAEATLRVTATTP
ncbi:hypothetical protein ACIPVK_16220 [Paeniglutamicibacter sp. MACA_103]|uniref:hypothetical protein n=1 Tax=Paeniglutamicibacter sp. MACA_103 TaxID=3377337 RepID=UPI003893D940